jgi:hypothetical protein
MALRVRMERLVREECAEHWPGKRTAKNPRRVLKAGSRRNRGLSSKYRYESFAGG